MNFRFWFIPSVLLLLVASSTHAVVITIPPALDPGDQYRLVFVTSGTRDAIPTDIEVYNNFVQSAADAVPDLASLAVTWKAMGSSASVAARENTDSIPGVDDVPIFLLDGSKFADDYGDLWDGSLDIPLNIDETGNLAGSLRVWTGSNEFGQIWGARTFGSSGGVKCGYSSMVTREWMAFPDQTHRFEQSHLYAMSDVLTVPEPGTFTGLLIALAGAGVLRVTMRSRKRERH